MKIAIIGSKGIPATYGGVQVVVENIAPQFVELGHSVTIYARSYYSENKSKCFKYKGVEVMNVRGFRSKRLDTLSHALISSILASRVNYDIVTFHSVIPAYFSFIPKMFGKATVLHSHGLEENIAKWNRYDKYLSSVLRLFTARYIDEVTTVSIEEVARTEQLYGTKVSYIKNGITQKKRKEVLKHEDYLLCVGRIVPGKGIEYLIQGFILLSESLPDMKLYIVGGSVYADDYLSQLRVMSEGNKNIIWKGLLVGEELIEVYEKALCVVVPSESESFSLVALEGLYYNGLVVCSDTDQFKKLYGDHVEYYESKSHTSLSSKIKKIVEDTSYSKKKRNKAAQFNFDEYNWDKIAESYIKLYDSILHSQ
jgi:glycosyltransferase involved in cell wall biosynthesis